MVWALTRRKLGIAVNRKRVLRVMREHKLIQRRRWEPPRRRRPGFFKVTRPAQLWHMDMSAVWVAEHGWVYLNAIVDCCTREIVGWNLDLRCRAAEAIAVIERAVAEQGVVPRRSRSGPTTPRRSPPEQPARRSAASRCATAVVATRDPESQAFIESWFSKLKERCVWRHEFETLDQAREQIAAYIDRYHHRPHPGLNYRTPTEVRQARDDAQEQPQKQAA
jgi:putative transposase